MVIYKKIIENEKVNDISNISKNYRLFCELVDNSSYSPEEIYKALRNLEVVYIALDNDKDSENPQLIFESLNSTGLRLEPADLIRNFLLMNHKYDEQERLYKYYWLKVE